MFKILEGKSMTGDQQKDALEERQKEIDEALATSDACWRMEQEVLQRQLDEARAEVDRLRALLDGYSTGDE
jgi:hypothetical protein